MTTVFERPFTNEVMRFARDHNWVVFHIHDQDSRENYRKVATGSGFPDLVMYRIDDQGKASMVVAELKTDADYSVVKPSQEPWLKAYGQFIPTFVWRPSDWDDIEQVLRDGPPETQTRGTHVKQATPVRQEEEGLPRYWTTIVENLRSELREQEFPTGSLAELRRMNVERAQCPAFHRISAVRGLFRIGGDDANPKWAAITQGMAIMAKSDFGQPMPLGKALFTGGDNNATTAYFSSHRFAQLLTAHSHTLRTLMRRAFRMLAAAEQPFYWRPVARLILNDGYNDTEAQKAREEIARSYYGAESNAQRKGQNAQEEE